MEASHTTASCGEDGTGRDGEVGETGCDERKRVVPDPDGLLFDHDVLDESDEEEGKGVHSHMHRGILVDSDDDSRDNCPSRYHAKYAVPDVLVNGVRLYRTEHDDVMMDENRQPWDLRVWFFGGGTWVQREVKRGNNK